ncbi:AAA family ATPase [Bacillus inaquosorum]|uniref:AAA family ATPase n=1 Tax=Bacillus inaquosorum TaxID=483913 RepID=UPI00227DE3C9|nr:AAA family ATPase [Bacillus inaquosorum]MCY8284935.1 AAA family ATPase [Bacillus inaquosorum]MCY9380475.1 AAA family ATPase [Bacillus inaquosorum]
MKKEIKLLKLELRNFKGIKHFTLDTQGENVKVYGDNATGKTTLFDAFIWLLFDKDSQNKKDFQIKTLTKENKHISGLNHEVSGLFLVDGAELSLKKVYSEKWTKKRSSAEAVFSGHTTDYFINEVPSKKKEFNDRVSSIIEEDKFKLITSPSFFNEQLKWQDRRKILLEISGDVTAEEVFSKKPSVAALESILNKRSIEEHRKVIAGKQREINKQLDAIPVRIDEVQRTIEDTSGLDEQELHDEINFLQKEVESLEEKLRSARNGEAISEKRKVILQLQNDLQEIKNGHQEKEYKKINEIKEQLYPVKSKIDEISMEIKSNQRQLSLEKDNLDRLNTEIESLRQSWCDKNEETFDQHQTECPTCGQELPKEKIDQAIEKFNFHKSQALAEINEKGKSVKSQKEKSEDAIQELEAAISNLQDAYKSEEETLLSLEKELEGAQSNRSDISADPIYQNKQAEIEAVRNEIQHLESSTDQAVQLIKDDINSRKQEILLLQKDQAKIDHARHVNDRVRELEQEQKELAEQYEQLQHQLFLTEEFVRTKVHLLEEKINSKFKYARFKLFKDQINGGLEETCETLYEGVPYSSGLNNAARINVGLDIINTLNDYYGITAPIFVDNSEAVTKLINTNSQILSLIVSEKDKQLRVEFQDELVQEAI